MYPSQVLAGSQAPELVIIGHLAINEDATPYGTSKKMGGSAYHCALGAATMQSVKTAIFATAGYDFDFSILQSVGIHTDGIVVDKSGPSARFFIRQKSDGSRTFKARWGVVRKYNLNHFPSSFLGAKHIHLSTTPPAFQLAWLKKLKKFPNCPVISVDIFEHFVKVMPEQTRQVCELADMVFMNEEESQLFSNSPLKKPVILKKAADGVEYITGKTRILHPAPLIPEVVDTTGAGEVVAGVFLASRIGGVDVESALKQAVELASRSIMDFGVEHILSLSTFSAGTTPTLDNVPLVPEPRVLI